MWSTMIFRFPARAQFLSRAALVTAGMTAVASYMGASSPSGMVAQCEAETETEAEGAKVALSPKEFRSFRVRKVETVNYNTKRITFDLPSPEHEMGIKTPSCLLARAKVAGKTVTRPYTPTNVNEEKGFLELMVKGYPEGRLSKHMVGLKEGDELEMKGPFHKFEYYPNRYKQLGLIAGGSGLTPMLQLAKTICRDSTDKTNITLICANVAEEDIILSEELDALQYLYPQFRVVHVLSNPSADWTGHTGFVSKELLQEEMPEPSDENLICVCGPPPMMYHVSGDKAVDYSQGEVQGLLKELKYSSKQVFKF